MSKLLVAAAQLGPASPTRAETVSRIVRLLEQAASEGVKLAVFSELALSPYFAASVRDDAASYAELDFPSAETAPIFDLLARTGIEAVLPFAEIQNETLYNSAALIGPDGEIGRFRKMHIPGLLEPAPDKPFTIMEKRYFAPGDLGFPVYPSVAGPLGMLICYDRRFPESYRTLSLNGAEVIAIGYNTPVMPGGVSASIEHGQGQSELAMRAGAYANGVPVIAAGKAGMEWGAQYIGGSLVIGPTGDVLAKATSDGDELVLAEIDLEAAMSVRTRMNLALNRRPEEYRVMTATAALAGV